MHTTGAQRILHLKLLSSQLLLTTGNAYAFALIGSLLPNSPNQKTHTHYHMTTLDGNANFE